MKLISGLFEIEGKIRDLPPEDRLKVRVERSASIVRAIWAWRDGLLAGPKLAPPHELAKVSTTRSFSEKSERFSPMMLAINADEETSPPPAGLHVLRRTNPALGSSILAFTGLLFLAGCGADKPRFMAPGDPSGNNTEPSSKPPDATDSSHVQNFIMIPAGRFNMGAPAADPGAEPGEQPVHRVEITRSFWLQDTEVTQGQWLELMGSNPAKHSACGLDCPVESISWDDSVGYMNALSDREMLPRCYEQEASGWTFKGLDCGGYRFPTEAEWEYAVRAGTSTTSFSNGKDFVDSNKFRCWPDANVEDIAWYCHNSGGSPHPVGQKFPNAWGLFDMHGNVNEWVGDWYQELFYSVRPDLEADPTGPLQGRLRAARGGSWDGSSLWARSSARGYTQQRTRQDNLGLRPARTVR